MKAWTFVYNPFVMGGNTRQSTGFEFDPKGDATILGGGYLGYVLTSPNGRTIVVEKTSGAIIGNSLDQVVNDIATGDPEVMKKQVTEACKENVRIITEEEFWKLYK